MKKGKISLATSSAKKKSGSPRHLLMNIDFSYNFLNKLLWVGKVNGSESSVVLKRPIYNKQFELGDP